MFGKSSRAGGPARPMPPGTRIAVNDVGKVYGGKSPVVALESVSLDIKDNEFVCLVGPSGCGKSSLLRIIADLQRPSSGSVQVASRPDALRPSAVVFQDYSIYPWKSVAENVRFSLVATGLPRREMDRRVAHWLEKLGLSAFAGMYPSALSGGMRQRVAIARAMVVESEILLMDEPFAALDAQLRRILQEDLLELWQEDRRTVLFVTHNLDEAILLGDRVVVMSGRPGHIIGDHRVPFERPRRASIRGTAEFAALEEKLWLELRSVVDTREADKEAEMAS
jgi:NitT/TauT family transport system ATP-binding protein